MGPGGKQRDDRQGKKGPILPYLLELFRSPEPETEEFSSLCKFGKALKKEEEEEEEAVAASPSFPEYNGPREKKGSCKKGKEGGRGEDNADRSQGRLESGGGRGRRGQIGCIEHYYTLYF